MKPLAAALLVVCFCTACEKKPTEEEVQAQEQEKKAAEVAAKATPTPKPGDWMWNKYQNPLDKSKQKH